jgi:hypothetical protein
MKVFNCSQELEFGQVSEGSIETIMAISRAPEKEMGNIRVFLILKHSVQAFAWSNLKRWKI